MSVRLVGIASKSRFLQDQMAARQEAQKRAELREKLWPLCATADLEGLLALQSEGLTPEDIRAQHNHAVQLACQTGKREFVAALVQMGSLTLRDLRANGNYALFQACAHGHLEIVKFLFGQALTVEDVRANNAQAFTWACHNGHLPVVAYLMGKGLTVRDVRNGYHDALRLAVEHKQTAVMRYLIQVGLYSYTEFVTLFEQAYADRMTQLTAAFPRLQSEPEHKRQRSQE